MYFSFSLFRNENVPVLRYGAADVSSGVAVSAIEKIEVMATITPRGERSSPPSAFTRTPEQRILFCARMKDALQIDEAGARSDVIYWRERFWRAISAVSHRFILPHTESEAVLIARPEPRLLELV